MSKEQTGAILRLNSPTGAKHTLTAWRDGIEISVELDVDGVAAIFDAVIPAVIEFEEVTCYLAGEGGFVRAGK